MSPLRQLIRERIYSQFPLRKKSLNPPAYEKRNLEVLGTSTTETIDTIAFYENANFLIKDTKHIEKEWERFNKLEKTMAKAFFIGLILFGACLELARKKNEDQAFAFRDE